MERENMYSNISEIISVLDAISSRETISLLLSNLQEMENYNLSIDSFHSKISIRMPTEMHSRVSVLMSKEYTKNIQEKSMLLNRKRIESLFPMVKDSEYFDEWEIHKCSEIASRMQNMMLEL